MYDILFLVVILLCLAAIIFVISRKFPQLTNLDVDNLPEEQEARKKQQILSKRIEDRGSKIKGMVVNRFAFGSQFWRQFQLKFRIYVGKIEKLLHHEQNLRSRLKRKDTNIAERKQKTAELVKQGEQWLHSGDYDRAEDLFIEAIKWDVKSGLAYRGLADAYFAKGLMDEAEETYRFLLQLDPKNDAVMVKLAEIAEGKGKIDDAVHYYEQSVMVNNSLSTRFYHLAGLLMKMNQTQVAKEAISKAVDLEPKNPKYLDLLIEIAIICDDKQLAEEGYNELRLVNPSNNKLVEFKQRIAQVS